MTAPRGFALITGADFIVRSAYQMGKTPLLPIYAAALGAGDAFLGLIVAVSTLTGMVLKPFVGLLSDRWGRRGWLLVGTAFFAGIPFAYRLVETPEHLFAIRMLHGLATAIYGPVTLAYVAELSGSNRAERLGWFAAARNAGYVIGPGAAGLMLLFMDPVTIFTVIGLLSTAAFVPVLLLPEASRSTSPRRRPLLRQAIRDLRSAGTTPAVWTAGALAGKSLFGLYAVKAFLPVHALSVGVSPAAIGAFFVLQEAVHMALSPLGGRLGDRVGHHHVVAVGMALIGGALMLLPQAEAGMALMAPAALMGLGQALFFPSNLAQVSAAVDERNLGLGLGLVGSLKNAGKVAGPIVGGALIYWLDFTYTFRLLGAVLVVAAFAPLSAQYVGRVTTEKEAAQA